MQARLKLGKADLSYHTPTVHLQSVLSVRPFPSIQGFVAA